jgi:hypothetical protein
MMEGPEEGLDSAIDSTATTRDVAAHPPPKFPPNAVTLPHTLSAEHAEKKGDLLPRLHLHSRLNKSASGAKIHKIAMLHSYDIDSFGHFLIVGWGADAPLCAVRIVLSPCSF